MAKNTKEVRSDDLASVLKNALNDKLDTKTVRSVYALDDSDNPSNVYDFISTGCDALDLAISNRPNGGLPVGRIAEITGLEQTGKSVLCASIIAQTQKKGGMGIFIDTENAVSKEFFQMLGVDISRDKFLYVSESEIENIFEAIDVIIGKSIEQKNKKYITICVDSIAGATTRTEMESDYGKDGYATTKALVISKAMRKLTQMIGRGKITLVLTNQLRQILNAQPFAEQWTSPGGKAIPFHATVRIRLNNMGKIKGPRVNNMEPIVGQKIQAKIVKNRVGPPHTYADYDFYFSSGIDNYGSWLTILKKHNLIKSGGAWYNVVDESTGEEIKFQSKDFSELMKSNGSLREQLYLKICNKLIMTYEKKDFGIDDVSVVNDDDADIITDSKEKEKRQLLVERDNPELMSSISTLIDDNVGNINIEVPDFDTMIDNELPEDVRIALQG